MTEGAAVGPVCSCATQPPGRTLPYAFAASNIVNGDVSSGAEKQERFTKEGKDLMSEEFAAPLDRFTSCFLAKGS